MSSLLFATLVLVAGGILLIVYKFFPMNDLLKIIHKGITVLFVLLWLFSMGWFMYSLTIKQIVRQNNISQLFQNNY